MNQGYIKLHRKLLEWEWYQDANTFRLFLHLLMKANHKDSKWQGQLIKRGQLVTGRKTLSVELKMSERSIRTAFDHLIKTKELTSKATNRNTLVTLMNYDSYQSDVIRTTNQLPSIDQLLTTNKNVKNVKKINILRLGIENFEETIWLDFVKHRKTIKKPLTDQSANMALNKLSDFHSKKIDVVQTINNSIEQGWSGLFEPKKQFKSNSVTPIPQPKSDAQVKSERDEVWQKRGFSSEKEMDNFDFKLQQKRYEK